MLDKLLDKIPIDLSSLLPSGGGSVIGVDIGLSAVKVAEVLKSGDSYKLNSYASVRLPEGALIEDEIQKEEEIANAIVECFKEAGLSLGGIAYGFSGPNAVVKKIQLAGGTEEEIEDQVAWDAEQYLPFSIEDCKYDYQVISENEGGGVDVIVAAVKKSVVENFKDLFDLAKVKLRVGDLNAVAVANIFDYCYEDQLGGNSWAIVDYGAQKTHFMVYKNGVLTFHKEIPVGGIMITEEIQRRMGVNYFEAEDLKIQQDENGNLPQEVLEIVRDVHESIFGEIHKAFDFYITTSSDESVVGCVATGGALQTVGFLGGLEDILGMEVRVLNPFEHIDYNEKKFDEDEINDIAYRGVAAMGLGIRKG